MCVDFPYLIHIFYVGKIASLILLDKMPEGKLWAAHFLLVPSSRGVVGATIPLLQELRRVRLMRVADRWARPPFVSEGGAGCWRSRPFMILSLPRMISCVVHEWLSLHLSDGISYRVPSIDSPI
jgi:hypothetical protein